MCSQVRIHKKVISCVQHSSHSLDYGSVDQLLPLFDDGLLVGQVAKKGSTRRQVSDLSSWTEAWNIRLRPKRLLSWCSTNTSSASSSHPMAAALRYDSSFGRPQLCTSCIPPLRRVGGGRAGVVCHTSALSSRLTTTPAGNTPPSGAHGVSHPQCRPGDLPAF